MNVYRVCCSLRGDGAVMDTADRAEAWRDRYDRMHKHGCTHWVEVAELGPWSAPLVEGTPERGRLLDTTTEETP